MAFRTLLSEKPMPHLDLSDWANRVKQLGRTADALRKDAFQFRQDGLKLRTLLSSDSDWTTGDNNLLLTNRIAELKRWRTTIQEMSDQIDSQTKLLAQEKHRCDNEVIALQRPIDLLSEFFSIRDCRLGSELTYDEADKEIKDELLVLERNQSALQALSQKAFVKLNQLHEVKFKIDLEVSNKLEAEQLDKQILAMDRETPELTYKLDPTRPPRNAIAYDTWQEHTRAIVEMAKNELAETYAIRESMYLCRGKSRIILCGQQERTDFSIRKRIFDTKRACNELDYHIEKMQQEIQLSHCDLKALVSNYDDKEASLKLVQSRLTNRAERSGLELCLDIPHVALCAEERQLQEARRTIADRIELAKVKSNILQKHSERILIDLRNKHHSLATDTRAMALRSNLRNNDIMAADKVNQTDRNMLLLQMDPHKEEHINKPQVQFAA